MFFMFSLIPFLFRFISIDSQHKSLKLPNDYVTGCSRKLEGYGRKLKDELRSQAPGDRSQAPQNFKKIKLAKAIV